jgi:amino acid transporter
MAPPRDIELNPLQNLKAKEESLTHGSSHSMRDPEFYNDQPPPRFQRFLDGFKRDTSLSFFPSDHLSQVNSNASQRRYGPHYYDLRLAALESANTGLARKLKGRHLQMIAIGGSIGTPSPALATAI